MLANRNKSVSDVAADVPLSVDLSVLVATDTELLFEDLVALGKHFKRPWSYLLIDEAEVFDSAGQDNRSFTNQRRAPSPELLDDIEAVAEMLAAAAAARGRPNNPPSAPGGQSAHSMRGRADDPRVGVNADQAVSAAQAFSTSPSRLCCGSRITSPVSRSIFRTPLNPNGI